MVFCTYCGQSFTRDEHLERHILTRALAFLLFPTPANLFLARHQREALQMLHLPHVLRPAVSIPPRRTTLRRARRRCRRTFRLEPQELIVPLLGISCSAITPSTAETTITKKACRPTME
ncbi:hypothetical protein BKA80DRAFT_281549 [Phyllosticta citrichinensis]